MAIGIFGGGAEVNIIVRATDKFSKTFNTVRRDLKDISLKAGIIGGALAVGLGFAVKTAIDFESAFTGVRKTVDLTESGFEDLENRFKTLSTEIPTSFVELSRIGEIAGQLGVEGVDNLEKFTKTIAAIAVTTNLTAEDAATSFARIANIMQEPISNVDRMGAVVVELGNNFATTEREIVTFATRIAAAGKTAGLSTADIFGISTAFTSVGIQAELGGTAIIRVLNKMNKSVQTSDDNLALFAKTASLSIDEFTDLFRRDAAKAFEKFVLGLKEGGESAFITLDNLELGGTRIIQAFSSVAEAGDLISRSIATAVGEFGDLNTEFSESNALAVEAKERYEDMASKINIAKNRVLLLAEVIGEDLIEILGDPLLDALEKATDKFLDLDDATQSYLILTGALTAGFLILTATLGAAILFFGGFAVAVVVALALLGSQIVIFFRNWEQNMFGLQVVWSKFWNVAVDVAQEAIRLIMLPITGMIEALNLIPGISIPVPKTDFSGFKTALGKQELDELQARQSLLIGGFESATLETIPAQRLPDIRIEIDGVEIARALETEFTTQTST